MSRLNEAIEQRWREWRRKQKLKEVAAGGVTHANTVDENLDIIKLSLRANKSPVLKSSLLLYSISLQELIRAYTLELNPFPFKRVIEFSREDVSEVLWRLQGDRIAKNVFKGIVPIRTMLLKTRRVINEEAEPTYGDWDLIRQTTEEMLLSLDFPADMLEKWAALVSNTVEHLNGDLTVLAAQLELDRHRVRPDLKKVSSVWRK